MFDFKDRKDLLVWLIIGILLVVVILIVSLIFIWSPKEEKFEVGKISKNTEISDEYKVRQYLDKISYFVLIKDYQSLYKYLSQDYIQVYQYDVNKLKSKCEELKISGQKLLLQSFTSKNFNKFNNVYFVTAMGYDSESIFTLVIKEKSPMQFEFSFDEFVTRNVYLLPKTAENISLQILDEIYTKKHVTYNLNIKNMNKETLYINSNNLPGDFLLIHENNSGIQNNSSNLSSEPIKILPGEEKKYKLVFEIENIDWNSIKGIMLRDIKLNENKIANIIFEI